MADERNYFCFCEDNCKFPTMTKEQILAAIAQAVSTGEIKNVDAGFITRVVEQNKQTALYFWVGTQAEYNALDTIADDCHYFITDDSTKADIEAKFEELEKTQNSFDTRLSTIAEDQSFFGKRLWSSTDGVETYETINVNTGGYNTIAVTVKFIESEINELETTIICSRTIYTDTYEGAGNVGKSIRSFNGSFMYSNTKFANVSLDYYDDLTYDEPSKFATLKVKNVRLYDSTNESRPTEIDGVVSKIVGLM